MSVEAPRRIGLLGGSFDPPHLGHRALAQAALDHLGLDQLRWLPAGQPWQKASRTLAAAEHRLAMVRLMAQGLPHCVVDDRELRRAGPTYTIDTVRELHGEIPEAQFFLLLGQDQFARLHTWVQWEALIDLVTLAVAARDGQAPAADPAVSARTAPLHVLPMTPMAVSATQVRAALAAVPPDVQTPARGPARSDHGLPSVLPALVGEAVAGYIARHHLYRGLAST